MPRNSDFFRSVHLGQYGDPDNFNEATLPREGELGAVCWSKGKRYQLVQTDSHQYDSSTTPGPVAANQLAFWKNKATYRVTSNSRVAVGHPDATSANSAFRNEVAGVYRRAVTADYYCFVLQEAKGGNVSSAATGVAGDNVTAYTGTGAAATTVDAATAITVDSLGKVATAGDGTDVGVDLNIPAIP